MKTKITYSVITVLTVVFMLQSLPTRAQVMYGVTDNGGTYNVGTLFSINPSGTLETFANLNSTFAAYPEGSLLYASNGNFYASSYWGGYADSCTIWCCSPYGIISTSINLDSVWGSSDPEGNSLIQGTDGNLYGMTTMGGPTSYGVLFKLQLSGQYEALHFFSGTDGESPYGSLIQTSDGTFWGMTSAGGSNGSGNIFNYTTSGGLTSVYSFAPATDGGNPHGDLLFANDGNFYGLTYSGGQYNYGTLFRYSPGGTFTKLVDFTDTNGAHPYGSLVQASDGNLYGLTSSGGIIQSNSGYGTLFVCSLSGHLTTLMQFNDSINGGVPYGSLMQASDGNLYGMTYQGGEYNLGTLFQYSLSHVYTKLVDFNGANGANPMYGKLIEPAPVTTGTNKITNNNNARLFPNPNNGNFTFMLYPSVQMANAGSQAVLSVYNELGEKVYAGMLAGAQLTYEVNLDNQPNGIYFYRVTDATGSTISNGKFIVQK